MHAFLNGWPHVFQRGKSKRLNVTYHFIFTGAEKIEATVIIRDQNVEVLERRSGRVWLEFLAKETHLVWVGVASSKNRFQGRSTFVVGVRPLFSWLSPADYGLGWRALFMD